MLTVGWLWSDAVDSFVTFMNWIDLNNDIVISYSK